MNNRLNQLRKNKGLTQLAVGMKVGVDQSDYSKIERGRKPLSLKTAMYLAEFYGTSIDYIVGLTDNPEPYPRTQQAI